VNNIILAKLNVQGLNVKKRNVIIHQQNWLFCKYLFIKKIFLQLNFCSTSDNYIRDFKDETVNVCNVIMAGIDEITQEEAVKHKYRDSPVQVVDGNTHGYEYDLLFDLLQ
jgi:hypothetical protein